MTVKEEWRAIDDRPYGITMAMGAIKKGGCDHPPLQFVF